MNPTCGPFPWLMMTFQPCAIMSAMCLQVTSTAPSCDATSSCCLSRIKALPPTATTAVLVIIVSSVHREGHDGLLGVQPVLGFVVHHRLRAVHDGIGDLDVAVGGQRMHVDRIRLGEPHAALVGDPA